MDSRSFAEKVQKIEIVHYKQLSKVVYQSLYEAMLKVRESA
jgi:hypothetical protein